MRWGFRALLQSTSDLELVAQAEDLATALQAVAAHQAEVLVVEASVQTSGGAEIIAGLTREAGGTHVLLVSDWGRERDALDALAAGARGLALKTDSAEELLDAVRRVGRGQSYIAPAFRALVDEPGKLIRGRGQAERRRRAQPAIAPRTLWCLDLTVRGWDNAAIAKELNISIKTVDTHRTRMHRKLGCTRTSELIGFLAENGLLLPPLPQAERSLGANAAADGGRRRCPGEGSNFARIGRRWRPPHRRWRTPMTRSPSCTRIKPVPC